MNFCKFYSLNLRLFSYKMGIMITALIRELLGRLNEIKQLSKVSPPHSLVLCNLCGHSVPLTVNIFSYLLLPLKKKNKTKKQRETGFIECFLCTECYPGRYREHFTESRKKPMRGFLKKMKAHAGQVSCSRSHSY